MITLAVLEAAVSAGAAEAASPEAVLGAEAAEAGNVRMINRKSGLPHPEARIIEFPNSSDGNR